MRDKSLVRRTLTKAVSWETISLLLTLGIVYCFTSNVSLSLEITLTCFLFKILFLFVHERIWHQVRWGKIHKHTIVCACGKTLKVKAGTNKQVRAEANLRGWVFLGSHWQCKECRECM